MSCDNPRMWFFAWTLLSGCIQPSCPADQVYSPVFGQCIGVEQPYPPTTPPTETAAPSGGSTTPTGDTAAGG